MNMEWQTVGTYSGIGTEYEVQVSEGVYLRVRLTVAGPRVRVIEERFCANYAEFAAAQSALGIEMVRRAIAELVAEQQLEEEAGR